VSNKRAYRPRVAGDLNIGDVIKFRRLGGHTGVGQVHYIGHLPGKSEPFVGVELEHASESINSQNSTEEEEDIYLTQINNNHGNSTQ